MEFHRSLCRERIDKEELVTGRRLLCGRHHEEIALQTQAIDPALRGQFGQLIKHAADSFSNAIALRSDVAYRYDCAYDGQIEYAAFIE